MRSLGCKRRDLILAIAAAGVLLALLPAFASAQFSWTTSTAADQALVDPTTGALDGMQVLCPSATECIGFGVAPDPAQPRFDSVLSATTFNPATPASATHADVLTYNVSTPDSNDPPEAIACATPNRCVVVQGFGEITTFNPATGVHYRATGKVPAFYRVDQAIACPSIFRCALASFGAGVIGSFFPWLKGNLVTHPLPADPATGGVQGLACPTRAQCTAIMALASLPDFGGAELTFNPSTGAILSDQQVVPFAADAVPAAVACPSSSECVTAVENGTEVTFTPSTGAVVASASSGGSFSTLTQLQSNVVGCASTTDCLQVDGINTVFEGNPTTPATWQAEAVAGTPPATGLSLDALACADATECVATGNGLAIGTSSG